MEDDEHECLRTIGEMAVNPRRAKLVVVVSVEFRNCRDEETTLRERWTDLSLAANTSSPAQ
jgi:hypothetical protein